MQVLHSRATSILLPSTEKVTGKSVKSLPPLADNAQKRIQSGHGGVSFTFLQAGCQRDFLFFLGIFRCCGFGGFSTFSPSGGNLLSFSKRT